MLARGRIGITADERRRPQDILINLVLHAADLPACQTDMLEDTVDYSDVVKLVFALVENSQRKTVEAIAEDIANLCLAQKFVQEVTVRVEKPNRVRFTRLTGVEIHRERRS